MGFRGLDAYSGVKSWHTIEFTLSQIITTEQ